MSNTVSTDKIRELREMTSCGVIDCKKALDETGGDLNKAKDLLMKRGLEIAAKKGSREAREGRIEAYAHAGNQVAVLLEVNCETDFVARSDDFVNFCRDLAMHICWAAPLYIRKDEVPADVLKEQEDAEVYVKEKVLLEQNFVKDQGKTVQDILNGLVAKIGENILINRFSRYKIGENS